MEIINAKCFTENEMNIGYFGFHVWEDPHRLKISRVRKKRDEMSFYLCRQNFVGFSTSFQTFYISDEREKNSLQNELSHVKLHQDTVFLVVPTRVLRGP